MMLRRFRPIIGVAVVIAAFFLFFPQPNLQNLSKTFHDNPQYTDISIDVSMIRSDFMEVIPQEERRNILGQFDEVKASKANVPEGKPTAEVPAISSGQAVEEECIAGFRCFKFDQMMIEVEDGLYTTEIEDLKLKMAKAYISVLTRNKLRPSELIHARFYSGGCDPGLNGFTEFVQHLPKVFTCGSSVNNAVIIMAHELGHQLSGDNFNCYLGTDFYLSEGFSTWGAGEYWLNEEQDFRAYANTLQADHLTFDTSADSNKYIIYASFVQYIVDTYGLDAFYKVYNSASEKNCQTPFGFDHVNYGLLGDLPGHPGQKLTLEDVLNGWRVWLAEKK